MQSLEQQIRLVVTMPSNMPFLEVMKQTLAEHMNAGRVSIVQSQATHVLSQPTHEPTVSAPVKPTVVSSLCGRSVPRLKSKDSRLFRPMIPEDAHARISQLALEHQKTLSDVIRPLVSAWLLEHRADIENGKFVPSSSHFTGKNMQLGLTIPADMYAKLCTAMPSVLSKEEASGLTSEQKERVTLQRVIVAALSDRAAS